MAFAGTNVKLAEEQYCKRLQLQRQRRLEAPGGAFQGWSPGTRELHTTRPETGRATVSVVEQLSLRPQLAGGSDERFLD